MRPHNHRLAVVTACLDPASEGTVDCLASWQHTARYDLPTYVVGGVYGVVPAFASGVQQAFADGAESVCCFHDDLRIDQVGWDVVVQEVLDSGVKFAGFGGATQLGSADLYQTPYDPMQLARGGFVSNMQDAEAHGRRSTGLTPCVCFDGFCQIGTKDWFAQAWQWLEESGVYHHGYDGMLGCLAARAGVQPGMMIPVACHHYGGRTAVGSQDYQRWAFGIDTLGDQGLWLRAHQVWYESFKDVLPLRLGGTR